MNKDLKFGCRIKHKGRVGTIIRRTRDLRIECCFPDDSQPYRFWVKDVEIIGQPIRLADIVSFMKEENFIELCNKWNKSNDDIDLQSEETEEFIKNLIGEPWNIK